MNEQKVIIDRAPGTEREELYCSKWGACERVLEELLRRSEGCVLLVDKNGDYMLFGVEHDVACIQFCPHDPVNTPKENLRNVLWAVDDDMQNDGFVEFNFGGTGTEINAHNCISPSLLIPVAKEYFAEKKLSNLVEWIPE